MCEELLQENCFLGTDKSQVDRHGSLASPQNMMLMQKKGFLNFNIF